MAAPTNVPAIIARYFAMAINPDREQYFALFADDATVEGEGNARRRESRRPRRIARRSASPARVAGRRPDEPDLSR